MRIAPTGLQVMLMLVLMLSSPVIKAQVTDTAFRKEWMVIDSLITKDDLTKTALARVKQVYSQARQRNLNDQVLKTLLYQISLEDRVVTDDPAHTIKTVQAELARSTDPVQRSLLQLVIAKQFQRYFDNNRWKLYGRKKTTGIVKDDITTWGASDFTKEITHDYLEALKAAPLLKQKPGNTYQAIIIKGTRPDIRPTLFDLVAHEALDYFKSVMAEDEVVTASPVSDPAALAPVDVFTRHTFNRKDSLNTKYLALQLFQQLLAFHRNDISTAALVTLDLERLEWVHGASTAPDRDAQYEKALRQLTRDFPKEPETAGAWFQLARLEVDKAATYRPFTDTANRYSYVTALDIIKEGLSVSSVLNTWTAQLKNLETEILRKDLRTEIEKFNVPGKPILAGIHYRNADTLFTRILRVLPNDTVLTRYINYTGWASISKRVPVKTGMEILPGSGDHQEHFAQFKVDELAPGYYALYTSTGKNFIDSTDKLSLQYFSVSAISYAKNGNDFFVVNRETGQPIANAEIRFTKYAQGAVREKWELVTTRRTDANGYATYNASNGSWKYIFKIPGDSLDTEAQEYVYNNEKTPAETPTEFEKTNNRVFFFLDRAIYRPGQQVYFKGIGITRDKATGLSKLIAEKTSDWVYLKDVNFKIIDSVRFELNAFGSFQGKFQLPQTGLTGNFRLETKGLNRSGVYFSVEEYKRPTFSVSLDKPKGTYRLNDTIVVTGHAKAYSGNSVDHAKLVYDVTRNMRYTDPWTYRRIGPVQGGKPIAHGEAVTDAQGNFQVRFRATADDILDSAGMPVFNFIVKADITDNNGETRSASTNITTGFHALLLNFSAPAMTDADSALKIFINTTNLSAEKEPAIVTVTIKQLQSPMRLIRTRMLSKPDQFIISRDKFLEYFPEDEYANEADMTTWPVVGTVVTQTINTAETNELKLAPRALGAESYRIEAETTDKYGRKVKQVIYTSVYDRKTGALPYAIPVLATNTTVVAEPGQRVTFITGTSIGRTFVIRKTANARPEQDHLTFDKRYAGMETINYNVTEADHDGVTIQEFFVYHNRPYTNNYQVNVPWTNKQLDIEYASYRDKAEPGQQEKWTITIKGKDGENKAAELLTGMYDASLDMFRSNNWSVPDIWNISRARTSFVWNSNFGIATGNFQNQPRETMATAPAEYYDRLAATAEEIWEENLERLSSDLSIPPALRQKALDYLRTSRPITRMEGKTASMAMSKATLNEVVQIRGSASAQAAPVNYTVDGARDQMLKEIDPNNIASVQVDETGIVITTKNPNAAPVQVRKNLVETAFFFPQLYADSAGRYSFSFTMPEALTQWKWMTLAHTKDLSFGSRTTTIVTQKNLMVQPNAPRFMREGDNMEFSSKIVNMTDKEITGQATLELIDAITNTSVDGWFQNLFPSQYFTIGAGQSVAVKFPIQIPFSFNKPLRWRVVARAGNMSDGEENTLPVLTNRMLVTETLPLYLPNDTTKHFSFDKLLHNTSESLSTESLTIEYTSNPVWYAVQALPYLINYPYECAEQTFNRFYANTLASFIINKHPRLKPIFEAWRKDSTALLSNLQKNEELKQVLLQETPWVFQAESEAQQKKNLALLFDLARLSAQSDLFIQKLEQQQLPDGSFSWFKGGYADRYITNYIMTGIGKLKRLGALTPDLALRIRNLTTRAIRYLDAQLADDYDHLIKNKADLSVQQMHTGHIDYLYMRSFFRDMAQSAQPAYDYYYGQAKKFWVKQNTYYKAQIGLISFRTRDEKFATEKIFPALLENSSTDTKMGMYWKTTYANWWYQSPIEHQAMMIAFFSEINLSLNDVAQTRNINAMKTWLLLNKQTNNWGTTIATADACYALLLNGSDWLSSDKKVTIQLGNYTTSSTQQQTEAGTGYFKNRIDGRLVKPEMGNITVTTSTNGNSPTANNNASQSPSWGSVYWQYFEDLDKITPSATPLSIGKKLFLEKNTDKGKLLEAINEGDELKAGDKVVVRLELRSDRDMDYLHLKDMRAATMEPVNVLSGYKWQDGLGYYESTRDASTNFFISHLNKGTYVFEYPLFITHTGIFSVGIASIQCMYAPQFTSHSEGVKIRVK